MHQIVKKFFATGFSFGLIAPIFAILIVSAGTVSASGSDCSVPLDAGFDSDFAEVVEVEDNSRGWWGGSSVNTDLSPEGNKVKISIKQSDKTHDFLVDEWIPFYIKGLDKGEVSITLELLDNDGELIETPFNPSSRTVVLE